MRSGTCQPLLLVLDGMRLGTALALLVVASVGALSMPLRNDTDVVTDFGSAQLKNFLLDPNYLNMNHGSFGATPAYVLKAQQELVMQMESKVRTDTYQTVRCPNTPWPPHSH